MKIPAIIFLLLFSGYSIQAQSKYANDRVYTTNQVSNSVSVVDPSTDKLLGEIKLGAPYPSILMPLYFGQALVHGLRYCPQRKMLAAVSIGSNSVVLISTENNKILKVIYIGKSPHEPTFTPDGNQIWTSVRGEAYISVIDVNLLKEVKRINVANGPGMVSFSPDGKTAYVCSSFTPELDIVDAKTYQIIKKIPVVSPFSPNIFTSPKGDWVAMAHKDVGKVTVINTKTLTVAKVINTGAITNHVTFCNINNKLMMLVTVGGENKVRLFDVTDNFKQTDTINVGAIPHGTWTSADSKQLYIGLEYGDQIQHIDMQTLKVVATTKIGQSPQAIVYADNAVTGTQGTDGLKPLNDTTATQIVNMLPVEVGSNARGRLAARPIGLIDLIEQLFTTLEPNTSYTLSLTRSKTAPYSPDYVLNAFTTNADGKYAGQSTGLVNKLDGQESDAYQHIILTKKPSNELVLVQ